MSFYDRFYVYAAFAGVAAGVALVLTMCDILLYAGLAAALAMLLGLCAIKRVISYYSLVIHSRE